MALNERHYKENVMKKLKDLRTKTADHLRDWGVVYAMGTAYVAYFGWITYLVKEGNKMEVIHIVQPTENTNPE